jgi:ssDNA-binding replication factor A large subunit
MDENYERILQRISSASGMEKEEIERRVEAKRAKLSGLISKEGAAQVIAAELGINFEGERLKINELLSGMRKVNVVGKVINLFPVRTFVRNGKENKVANFVLADETSNIKVVLWNVNHIGLIETNEIIEGKIVEISGGSMRENEIHLGSFSELKLSKENIGEVKTEKILPEKTIANFKQNDNVSMRGFVVQIFDPKFFNVCPECKKKVILEGDGTEYRCSGEHGKIIPEKRALLNIVIDDGTETIRSVLFGEALKKIGLTELENLRILAEQKQEILGKEFLFFGNVRNNAYFHTLELITDDLKEVNANELLAELEKN